MKRILSALTALCMCASMTAGVLPASAINALTPANAVIANAGGEYEWAIDNVVYDPKAAGGDPDLDYFELPIKVYNDPGTNGFEFTILIDGKKLDDPDCPFEYLQFDVGDAYQVGTKQQVFGTVAGTMVGDANNYAKDGSSAFIWYLGPKEGVEYVPGTVYAVTYDETENFIFGDEDKNELFPKGTAGSITIAGGETTPSSEATEPSKDATEPSTGGDTSEINGYTWKIDDVEYDPDAAGGDPDLDYFELPIKIYNDPGTNGFEFTILIDGKKLDDPDCPFEYLQFEVGDAYKVGTKQQVFGTVAGTMVGDANNYAKDGSSAFVWFLGPKPGVKYVPGTVYAVTYDKTENFIFGDEEKNELFPTGAAGSITIVGNKDDATEPSTDEPTEPSTDKPTEPPTEPSSETTPPSSEQTPATEFVQQEKEVDMEWVIEHKDDAKPGEEVVLNVYVNGNTNGFNSYMTKLKYDSPVTTKSTGGRHDDFSYVYNLDDATFAGTATGNANVTWSDTHNVFAVRFVAPTKPGRYMIDFDTLEVYDGDMVKLIPKTTAGWIEVKGEETTEFVHETNKTNAKWKIQKYEDAEPGETVKIAVSVEGDDTGLNSYKVKIDQDAGPVAKSASIGDAYAELGFEANTENLTFGGTNSSKGENIKAAGDDVFYIEFKVPEDAQPGALYNLKFADIDLEDISMTRLIPEQEDGWIRVKSEKPVESAGKWIIGKETVEPGAEVTIPVTVTGDVNGLNSYIMKMGMDPGPIAKSAVGGDAYEPLSFVSNIDEMTFAGTNPDKGENIVAKKVEDKDGAVVFEVTFTAPEEPGKYNLTFADLDIYDMNMSVLMPETENGWIEVKAPETQETSEKELQEDVWEIGHATVDPGAEVVLDVTVTGNTYGFNSYIAKLGFDDVVTAKSTGGRRDEFSYVYNLDEATFAGTATSKANVFWDGTDKVFAVRFVAPTEPGIYPITFADLQVYDADMDLLNPKKIDGYIEVKAPDTTEEPTETTEAPTEPTETTEEPTETTEAPSETTEPAVPDDAGKWIIGHETVAPGAEVTIPVTVTGDKNGINSFIMKMGMDKGPIALSAADADDAYAELTIISNIEDMTFAGTNPDKGANSEAADNAVIFTVTFTAPDEPGKYNLTFDGLEVYDINMSVLTPDTENGYIEVIADTTEEPTETTEEPTETTEEPTETTEEPTETTEAPSETTEPVVPDEAGKWIIGHDTVAPGAEVTIPVTVTGDKNGINSFIMKMGMDKGPIALSAADADDAYAELTIISNIENMTFAGTNPDKGANSEAADNAVIFTVTFTAPDEPGKYNLTFDGLEVYDINMSLLTPDQENGYIEVIADTTEEPTETTEEPTETTEAPTETTEPTTEEPDVGNTDEEPSDEPTETTEKVFQNDVWEIGHATVAPGTEVVLDVTVTGNTNGFNSYMTTFAFDDAVKAKSTGGRRDEFSYVYNLDTATFAGTATSQANVFWDGTDKVFAVRFVAPMEPGMYPITFADLQVYDADMDLLNPEKINGYIEVVADTTEEPTETTEEPTETTEEPTETTEEPTETTEEPTETTEEPTETTEEPTETTEEPTETTEEPTETTEEPPSESGGDATDDTTPSEQEPAYDLTATWQIGNDVASPGQKNVKIGLTVSDDTPGSPALALHAFEFTVAAPDAFEFNGATWGEAYDLIVDKQKDEKDPAAIHFLGENGENGLVQADNGSNVIYLSFNIPEDAAPGRYPITFVGTVDAYRMELDPINVIQIDGYIDILPDGINVATVEYQYNIEGKSKFYFAHDHRAFDVNDLLSMATLKRRRVYSEPFEGSVYSDWAVANELEGVTFEISEQELTFNGMTYNLTKEEAASPKGIYDTAVEPSVVVGQEGTNAYFRSPLKFEIHDANVDEDTELKFVEVLEDGSVTETDLVTGDVFIGVKGDVTLNGIPNAVDAAQVLKFAAAYGAGNEIPIYTDEDEMLERFVYFLGDVTGESEDHGDFDSLGNANTSNALNAVDAARILVYAAEFGAHGFADWYTILPEPLPKYTEAIGPLQPPTTE